MIQSLLGFPSPAASLVVCLATRGVPRLFVTPWQLNDRLVFLLLGPYPTVSLQFESILAIYKESLYLKRIELSCSDHSFSMVW